MAKYNPNDLKRPCKTCGKIIYNIKYKPYCDECHQKRFTCRPERTEPKMKMIDISAIRVLQRNIKMKLATLAYNSLKKSVEELEQKKAEEMNRAKREVKAPKRLIEEDGPTPKKPTKRTLNLDIGNKRPVESVEEVIKTTKPKTPKNGKRVINMKVEEAPPVDVEEMIKDIKIRKANSKAPTRTLTLDLPPSSDIKFSKDWGDNNNPFWVKHFYTPKDEITEVYQKSVEILRDILPANFQLYDFEPTAFGLANLELKNEFKRPIKKVPLMSKLVNKDYEIASSKSDVNIASSIKFFRKNLPFFTQFENDDDISWVINHHRLLVAELFEYYADQKEKGKEPRTATLKSRFNAITRIFRIAFDTKNYELYDKYSTLVIFLGAHFEDDEFNNELNEIELKKFITFDVVLDKQKELEAKFELIQNKRTMTAYDLNQDLLLISLYSLIPPLRNEVKTLRFNKTLQRKDDWIVIRADGDVLMDLNEEKKRHDGITFNLTEESPQLAKILKESYELYPREFLFTPYKKYPDVSKQASSNTLSDRISSIFAYTGKMVSVNTFRSSYVSYVNSEAIKRGRQMTVKDKEKLAYRMRTSRKYLDEAYLKIFPVEQQEAKEEKQERIINIRPVEEPLPAYQKQLNRNKKYYEDNKAKVLQKQKEYKDSRTPFDKSRVRMLHFINNDPEYYDKMKDATKKKYNFKKENGKWV